MRELSSLVGLQVIATSEGKRLGTVADALVDLAAGKLVALTLANTPELRVVLADDITVIGPDAVMIPSSDKVRSGDEVAEVLAASRRVLDDPPAVITTRGARIGQLGAVQIDEGSGRIIRFEVSAGPLKDVTEGTLVLPVVEGIVHGEDTVIVPHEVVARRLQQAGGLRGALRSLAQRLRTGYEHVSDRSEELLHESSEKLKAQAEEARKRAAEAAREAKEKAERLAQEAKEKAERLAEEAKEKASHLAEEAREKGARSEEDSEEATESAAGDGLAGEAAEGAADRVSTALAPETGTPLPGEFESETDSADASEEAGGASEEPAASDESSR